MKANSVNHEPVDKFTKDALFDYGSYVVEDRAVPDFRDGLKPSHRAIMWSMERLGLRSGAKPTKAALTVGATIGRFHPHGDTSSYGAMVTLANTVVPLVDGQGNWGSPVDMPAAYRYTEARMSKFADTFLLDKEYLKVVPYVDNFSGTEKYPLYLPSLLPFLLLNGSAPIPAYGVSAGNPSFDLQSIAKVVLAGLRNKDGWDTAKFIARTLKPIHEFGCTAECDKKEFREVIKTGRGSIRYRALMTGDQKARKIIISSFVPGALSSFESCEKTLLAIAALPGVKRAYSQQGKRTKGAGPYGACFVIETQVLKDAQWSELLTKVQAKVSTKVGVRLGVTVRHTDKPNSFHYLDFVKFFKAWIKYRIDLEVKLLTQQLKEIEERIYVNEVYLWAVDNIDQLLDALKDVLKSKDPVKRLAKIFKIPERNAEIILKRQVIQLARLERNGLVELLRELRATRKSYKVGLKKPGEYAADKTEKLVAQYMKCPDRMPYEV